ncbi:hypothetical protein PHMEG_00013446 [Phytophthora megakarya]|uniref:Uncharacterized protein n=1 Tax=Phytophthora megakarya TaxID=4795 RepID=A0A225W8V2_9STRA|nr:hypothetical protein PHMEG_00013446 [Phytophthora megakarya]
MIKQRFRERYDTDRDTVNSGLLTCTMWNTTSDSDDLPIPGTVVTRTDYSNLKLFRDTDCQATFKLRDVTWDS